MVSEGLAAKLKRRRAFSFIQITACEMFYLLYYYTRNFCYFIGLEQWYFSLIGNTYM